MAKRLVTSMSPWRLGFDNGPTRTELAGYKVTLGQIFLPVLPPKLQTHSSPALYKLSK